MEVMSMIFYLGLLVFLVGLLLAVGGLMCQMLIFGKLIRTIGFIGVVVGFVLMGVVVFSAMDFSSFSFGWLP